MGFLLRLAAWLLSTTFLILNVVAYAVTIAAGNEKDREIKNAVAGGAVGVLLWSLMWLARLTVMSAPLIPTGVWIARTSAFSPVNFRMHNGMPMVYVLWLTDAMHVSRFNKIVREARKAAGPPFYDDDDEDGGVKQPLL